MDVERADRELAYSIKMTRISSLYPLNYEKERQAIFKDKQHEPVFKYGNTKYDLEPLKDRLMKLEIDDGEILAKVLDEKRDELLKMIDMLLHIGTKDFTRKSMNLYGQPSQELVLQAKKFLNLEEEEEQIKYDKFASIKKFLEALLLTGLNWSVREKEMIVGATFNLTNKVIYLNKHRKFSENDVERLIVHEIGTHIMRNENGRKQNCRLFALGFPNYLATEEGLAVYNEEKAGLLSNKLMKNYAGRVMSIHFSLKNSFSTVYTQLLEYFNKEDAFTLTMRAKRGNADTSQPGAFTKDYLYLKGYYDVKKFAQHHDVKQLYVGKIGIQHIPLLHLKNNNHR